MKLIKVLAIASGIAAVALNSGVAFAKRDKREGFNFGTSVRLINNNDRAFGDASSGVDANTKVNSQSYNPFMAYSNGLLNLGITAHIESTDSTSTETNKDSGRVVDRSSSSDIKGTSVFGRFLFGKVMFMELGLGVYKQKVTVNNQYKDVSGASFSGTTDAYVLDSAGPGYHMGYGLELPITDGFYFTTSYIVRIFQLRDISDGSFGAKRAYQQKREITFGVEHYLN